MNRFFILKSILLLLIAPFNILFAGSPPSLNADVDLTTCNCTSFPGTDGYFNTNAQISQAFNFARRAEEVQFGLASGVLGNLVLPNNYSTLTDYQKGLFILNSERAARAGIDYDGSGPNVPVLGLLIENVDSRLNTLSQNHANYLKDNNLFTHNGSGGNAFERIQTVFGSQKEFLGRAENLYVSCGGFNSHLIEQAMFNWLYQDSGSAWGHRAALLIQNTDAITNQNGFDDNYGVPGSEGFIGFGILRDISFPLVCGPLRLSSETTFMQNEKTQSPNLAGNLVVFMVLDPSTTFQQALPVNLLSFDLVKKEDSSVEIKWETSSEVSNLGFEIEKSINGYKFQKIGFVKAKKSISEINSYSIVDMEENGTTAYYRLKQIDINGDFSYSKIKSIYFEKKPKNISLYPNPTADFIKFKNLPNNSVIEIYNSVGKREFLTEPENINTKLDTKQLTDGLYFLKIIDGINNHFFKIIVKK